MLLDLGPAALTAPALALSWTEVICPHMPLVAVDLNNSACLSAMNLEHDNLNTTTMPLRLAPHGINDFDTIMADLVLTVCELPECDLTPMACLFLAHAHGNYIINNGLVLIGLQLSFL